MEKYHRQKLHKEPDSKVVSSFPSYWSLYNKFVLSVRV